MPRDDDTLDRTLAEGVVEGRITEQDAAVVERFADYLARCGPLDGPLTAEQRAFRRETMRDPEWREFLGLGPLP